MAEIRERRSRFVLPVAVALAVIIVALGYFTKRDDHFVLLSLLGAGFGAAWYLYRSSVPVRNLVVYAFVLRLLLLFMFPNLSDDIYRFIWDGQLLLNGFDPFLKVPSAYFQKGSLPSGLSDALFNQLNSPDYYSVYPPMLQYIFALSGWVAGSSLLGNVIFLRIVILASEAGVLWLMTTTLKESNRNVLLYALNPAIILELTGNLHFESLMLCLVLAALVLSHKRWISTGLFYGAAVAVKVVPLIFGPFILIQLTWRKALPVLAVAAALLCVIHLPWSGTAFISGIADSTGLYFQKFEFNASLYFIVREIGFWRKGFNDIAYIGPFLAVVTFVVILLLSWLGRKKSGNDMVAYAGHLLAAYLLLATTVHPWYIAPLVGLTIFSHYRYGFIWSFTAMFSYFGYSGTEYSTPVYFLVLEYIIVYSYLFYEIYEDFYTRKTAI